MESHASIPPRCPSPDPCPGRGDINTGAGRSWSIAAHAPGGGTPVAGGELEVVVTLTWDAPMHDYVGAGCNLVGDLSDPRVPTMYFSSPSASPTSYLYPPCGITHDLSGDFLTATWTTTITAPSSAGSYNVTAYSRGATWHVDTTEPGAAVPPQRDSGGGCRAAGCHRTHRHPPALARGSGDGGRCLAPRGVQLLDLAPS